MTCLSHTSLRRCLPIAAALLASQCVLSSVVVAAPANRTSFGSIKAATLTTSDVTQIYGRGFKAFMNGVISNQDLISLGQTTKGKASLSATTIGRVTGFNSVWFRRDKVGSLSVTNALNEYTKDAFPHATFGQMLRQAPGHRAFPFHFVPFNGVGDEAYIVTVRSHGSTGTGILFRRGRYLAQVMVASQHSTVALANITKLALIEDHRIRAQG